MPKRNRKDSMMCRNSGCDKPHEFLQYMGKYYCLECFDELQKQPDLEMVESIVQAATEEEEAED